RSHRETMRDRRPLHRDLVGEIMPVLGVPSGVMRGIDDALAALSDIATLAYTLAVHVDHDGLVVGEEHHVSPFLDHRGGLLLELELPPVIAACLVGLLEFTHHGVGGEYDVDATFDNVIE